MAGFAIEQEPELRGFARIQIVRMLHRARARCRVPAVDFTSVGVPTVTKVSTRRCVCSTSSFAAFAGIAVAISAAVPRQRFGLPSSSQRAITASSATAMRYVPACRSSRSKMLRERPLAAFCGATGLAIGARHDQRIDRHRALVDREQVVRHGGIHRDPATRARQYGLRRQQPRPRRFADRGADIASMAMSTPRLKKFSCAFSS